MKNIIDYIKDKSYYLLGGIVIVIILLIIINACSNSSGSYDKIEQKMVNAAKSYYASHEKNLPKEESGTVKVTISTLIEAELLKEVKDPNNKNQDCSGYVEVTKVGKEYSYTPFLVCKGNYEPKYLTDIVKESKQDEYGNGVYEMGGEYVYRGDDVKNYVSFNNQLWRIISLDLDGNIELLFTKGEEKYAGIWDSKYNSASQKYYGVTTDYLHSDIRKILKEFYESNFDTKEKSYIISKNICIGKLSYDGLSDRNTECATTKENEKVGLLQVSDYVRSSLDEKCVNYNSPECTNRNYLSSEEVSTWLLTTNSENTYEVYVLNEEIDTKKASLSNSIQPVIFLTRKSIILKGTGSKNDPYIIKY